MDPVKPCRRAWGLIALGCLTVCGLAAFTQAAEVYKHVDAQGRVTYSDHPATAAAEKVEVRVQEANAAEAARLEQEQAVATADDKQRDKQKATQQQAAAKKVAADAAQQRRCADARARHSLLTDNSRIYRVDEKGNRNYYSSTVLDAQRISAKATMDSACSS